MSLDVLTLAVAMGGLDSGSSAKNGEDGFSPVITEHTGNDDTTYRLDITTKSGTITTPNLIGKQGAQGVPGKDGANGKDGAKGEAGERGEAGPAGPAGSPGEKGSDGASGKDGKYITKIELKKGEDGQITGGTATFNDQTTVTIEVTTTQASEAV